MKDHEYAMELYRIIKDYIILKMDGPDEEGYCYTLKSDAPPEVIEADKEFRSFAKDLEPIR